MEAVADPQPQTLEPMQVSSLLAEVNRELSLLQMVESAGIRWPFRGSLSVSQEA